MPSPTRWPSALPFEQGPPFDAPIEVRIIGPDVQVLRRLGEQVRTVLAESDRVTYSRAELDGGEPKLLVRADEYQARLAGLRLVDVADQLNATLEGAVGGSVVEATEEIPGAGSRRRRGARRPGSRGVELACCPRSRPRALVGPGAGRRPAPGASPTSTWCPELTGDHPTQRRALQHREGLPRALRPHLGLPGRTSRRASTASGLPSLPPGYRIELGGESEQRSRGPQPSWRIFALPLFVIMAGTIILSFNSFRMAGIIGVVAFLSIGLALLGVWLFGYPMGFLAIVGTMGLVGLAINGGIVVLSALRASPHGPGSGIRKRSARSSSERHPAHRRHHPDHDRRVPPADRRRRTLLAARWPRPSPVGSEASAILALYLVPSLFVSWGTRAESRRLASERE